MPACDTVVDGDVVEPIMPEPDQRIEIGVLVVVIPTATDVLVQVIEFVGDTDSVGALVFVVTTTGKDCEHKFAGLVIVTVYVPA